jgi:hypothetical protein
MTRSPFGTAARAFLVFAFLLAQCVAITHQIWHASTALPHHATKAIDGYDHQKRSPTDPLCYFHSALGTVLGIVAASVTAVWLSEAPKSRPLFVAVASASEPAPHPTSRGPPSFLPQ